MRKSERKLVKLLAKVMHELAFEIDAGYEDDDIGLMATEDSTFRVFRRALEELQARNAKVSGRVLHVKRRIEKAYSEAFCGAQLPPLDEE